MVQEEPRVPNKTQSRKVKFEKFLNRSHEITQLLDVLSKAASEFKIRRSTIRQLCMPLFKKLVAECTPADLAEICSQGDNFEPDDELEYPEAHIVTHGTNAWSAIFLSPCDTGLVLLQKIAVASLLSDVCETIVSVTPKNEKPDGLMPMEIINWEQIIEKLLSQMRMMSR